MQLLCLFLALLLRSHVLHDGNGDSDTLNGDEIHVALLERGAVGLEALADEALEDAGGLVGDFDERAFANHWKGLVVREK
jgi:hypothetical protein